MTIQTALNLGDDLKLRDDSGDEHPLATSTVTAMMAIGWAAFFLAWIINVAFYVVWQHYHSCLGGFSKHFLCRSTPLEWTWSPAGTRTSSPPMCWGRRGESWAQRWMDEVNYYRWYRQLLIWCSHHLHLSGPEEDNCVKSRHRIYNYFTIGTFCLF